MQPDGTKKRFRRRIITTTVITTRYVINNGDGEADQMESKPIETTTITIVDGKPVQGYVIYVNYISSTYIIYSHSVLSAFKLLDRKM